MKSDLGRSKALYSWVTKNIKYNWEEYRSGKVHNYTAYETFSKKMAVCNGFARLNAALHRSIGIKAKAVSGPVIGVNGSESHAWNEVYLDVEWCLQDPTFDVGKTNYKIF